MQRSRGSTTGKPHAHALSRGNTQQPAAIWRALPACCADRGGANKVTADEQLQMPCPIALCWFQSPYVWLSCRVKAEVNASEVIERLLQMFQGQVRSQVDSSK
jgi:hypothetical protein